MLFKLFKNYLIQQLSSQIEYQTSFKCTYIQQISTPTDFTFSQSPSPYAFSLLINYTLINCTLKNLLPPPLFANAECNVQS